MEEKKSLTKKDYYKELVAEIISYRDDCRKKKIAISRDRIFKLKVLLCKKYGIREPPTNIEIMLNTTKEKRDEIKDFLMMKPGRSLAGVSVCAVMSKPQECPHGECIMCPSNTKKGVPQSYTGREPASMRGVRNNFDPYLQVFNRMEQYNAAGHTPSKIEVIVMGGTFISFEKKYKLMFISSIYQALNDFSRIFIRGDEININKYKEFFEVPASDLKSKDREQRIIKKILQVKKENIKRYVDKLVTIEDHKRFLEKVKSANEKAKLRVVGLTIETRPDYSLLEHCEEMLDYGCTRVELGVQTVYDDVLKRINRGHGTKESILATKILKDLGFKINYHIMPGLPGSSEEKDLNIFKEIFENPDYKPDMLKIYPCMVMPGTKLYKEWKAKKFTPLSTDDAARIIAKSKKYIPEYVRVMRVQRDIPSTVVEAGVNRTNLRQLVEAELKKNGLECRCIRCREIGIRLSKNPKVKLKDNNFVIKTTMYEASGGTEYFISAEDKEVDGVFGFCRLRFPKDRLTKVATDNSCFIRELHVYGIAQSVSPKDDVVLDYNAIKKDDNRMISQHKGIGKKLLNTAEKIAKNSKKDKIIVISGVGVREYYRKLGYKKEGPYMVKHL